MRFLQPLGGRARAPRSPPCLRSGDLPASRHGAAAGGDGRDRRRTTSGGRTGVPVRCVRAGPSPAGGAPGAAAAGVGGGGGIPAGGQVPPVPVKGSLVRLPPGVRPPFQVYVN